MCWAVVTFGRALMKSVEAISGIEIQVGLQQKVACILLSLFYPHKSDLDQNRFKFNC